MDKVELLRNVELFSDLKERDQELGRILCQTPFREGAAPG